MIEKKIPQTILATLTSDRKPKKCKMKNEKRRQTRYWEEVIFHQPLQAERHSTKAVSTLHITAPQTVGSIFA